MNTARRILLVLVIGVSAAVTRLNAATVSASTTTAASSWWYCAVEYVVCCTWVGGCDDEDGACDALFEACLMDE